MVSEFYGSLGFVLDEKSENGDSVWHTEIENYKNKNKVIRITEKEHHNENK